MAGRSSCIVLLVLSVGARAADQPPDPPHRHDIAAAGQAQDSVTSRRRMLYHLTEGSEIFPLDWLIALRNVKTGKPFLEDPERFGLIQDPERLDVPGVGRVKLPIGLTIGTPGDVRGAIRIEPGSMPHFCRIASRTAATVCLRMKSASMPTTAIRLLPSSKTAARALHGSWNDRWYAFP